MKRITNRSFFEGPAEEVARNLLGKYIVCKDCGTYQIIETEAYYHDEKDEKGKYFCYGVKDDTGEAAKTYAADPLYKAPGTWCIYGGQLLLSATNCEVADNVLIKKIQSADGDIYTPDGMAKVLKLYQGDENSNYCNFHGLDSLSEEAALYLAEKAESPIKAIACKKRIGIDNKENYNFYLCEN